MHSMKQLQDFTKVQSGFDLTKQIILNLKDFNISPTSKLTLLYLASCYNSEKKYVFPKIETIANNIGISTRQAQRCINELIAEGLILKVKQKYNNNYYFFSKKIMSLSNRQIDTNNMTNCHKQHEQIKKEQIKEHHQDDFSFNSSFKGNKRKTTLADVPEHIKKNKKILNPCAYWHSLNEEEKKQQLEKAKQIEEKKQKALENQKRLEEEERKKAEERKANEEWNKLPLNEKFSKGQAIKHVWCLRKFIKRMKPSGLSADLIKLYNLDIDAIMQMSAEEVEIKTENEVKEL